MHGCNQAVVMALVESTICSAPSLRIRLVGCGSGSRLSGGSGFVLKLNSDKFANARSTAIRCPCGTFVEQGQMIQCEVTIFCCLVDHTPFQWASHSLAYIALLTPPVDKLLMAGYCLRMSDS